MFYPLGVLLSFFFVTVSPVDAVPTHLPPWAQTHWTQAQLGHTFRPAAYARPYVLHANFNGDGKGDVALLVTRKTTGSQGIILLHQGLPAYHVLGARPMSSSAIVRGNFSWVTHWRVYTRRSTMETTFANSGDTLGSRKVALKHPAIEFTMEEQGGGLLYWNGKRYIWIHQTC